MQTAFALTAIVAFAAAALVSLPVSAAPGSVRVVAFRNETMRVKAPGVSPTSLRVRVLLPPGYHLDAATRWPVLYLDDGQDAEAVGLAATLAALARNGAIRPPIVVAIDAPVGRLGAYGFSDRENARGVPVSSAYGEVGTHAHAYARWLTHTLVPLIDARYRTQATPAGRTLLGWSLGGVSAFDIGWQYPELFARVGAFSPSLWLASDRSDAASSQRTRLGQLRVATTARVPCVSLFIAVGTNEETDDRDGDGNNDALDDVTDLVNGWAEGEPPLAGLRQRGVRVVDSEVLGRTPVRGASVALFVLPGGEHRAPGWARMLPRFLRWAYGPDARAPQCADRHANRHGRRIGHVSRIENAH